MKVSLKLKYIILTAVLLISIFFNSHIVYADNHVKKLYPDYSVHFHTWLLEVNDLGLAFVLKYKYRSPVK